MKNDVMRFERDLRQDPACCERILREPPPVPEGGIVLIRTSPERVDEALVRALALAADGVLARVEFV